MQNKNKESDYEYLERTIGPGTWVYEILQQNHNKKDWDLLQTKLKDCKNNQDKQHIVAKSFRNFGKKYNS